jgi:hypothetical protein
MAYGQDIYNQGDVVWRHGHPCRWIQRNICEEQFTYKGVQITGCTMMDNDRVGWCSVDPVFQGNWRKCYLSCQDRTYHHPERFIVNKQPEQEGLLGAMPRRLEEKQESSNEEKQDSDRFVVDFEREGVHYNIDEELIRSLLRRKAFRGMRDAQGEAEIVGFRVHTGDTKPGEVEMLPVGPEDKFEKDYYGKQVIPDEPSRFDFKASTNFIGASDATQPQIAANTEMNSLSITMAVAGIAVFAFASLVVGWRFLKRQNGMPYASVEAESE